MQLYEFGPEAAENVLIQPVGDHDLPLIENEIAEIRRRTEIPFRLTAVKVESWNRDLSPWPAPAVFGNEDFGDGAAALLREILPLCADEGKRYFIGGYSMAGLFALWSAFQTEAFSGAAASNSPAEVHLLAPTAYPAQWERCGRPLSAGGRGHLPHGSDVQ